MFETENFAALGIDSRHDVPDGAILAGRVHPHGDLKEKNILRNSADGVSEYSLTDFSFSRSDIIAGTEFYQSPEYIDFIRQGFNKTLKVEDFVKFNAAHGKPRDLWNLGVVIINALMYRAEQGFMEWRLKIHNREITTDKFDAQQIEDYNATIPDWQLILIKQQEIDNEIDDMIMLKGTDQQVKMEQALWKLAKGLLRMRPQERLTAANALKTLEIEGIGKPISDEVAKVRCIWPKQLARLAINEQGKAKLEQFIQAIYPHLQDQTAPEIVWEKTPECNKATYKGKTWELPLKVYLVGNAGERRPILNLKTRLSDTVLIAEGGERKVKRSYDPIGGEFFAKKIVFDHEIPFIKKYSNCEGVVKNIGIVENIPTKDGKVKHLVFEYLYEMNMIEYLQQITEHGGRMSADEIYQFARCILRGLVNIHITGHHGDVKELNILRRVVKGVPEYGLTDFSFSNPDVVGATPYYQPQEYVEFILDKAYKTQKAEDFRKYNRTFGKPKDMWAMGTVLSYLLMNRQAFKWYEAVVENNYESGLEQAAEKALNKKYLGWMVTYVNQEDIDKEIDLIVQNIEGTKDEVEKLKILWTITAGMLRREPLERITASKALKMLV